MNDEYIEMGEEETFDLEVEFSEDFGSPYIDNMDGIVNTGVIFGEGGIYDDR